jgi:hypothetical protein
MEKVKIKSAIDSGKVFNNQNIITIELEDGRKGSAFTPEALKWSGEMELEVKDGKEYNGQKQYVFYLPRSNNKQFPVKDWVYEKRLKSLECSINSIKLTEQKITSENILSLADKYYEYLNRK